MFVVTASSSMVCRLMRIGVGLSAADLILELERGQRVVTSEAAVHARRAQLLRLRPQRLETLDVVLTLRHGVDHAGKVSK